MKHINRIVINIALAVLLSSIFNITMAKGLTNNQHLTDVAKQIERIAWHSLADDFSWGYELETTLDKGDNKKQQRIQKFNPSLPSDAQWRLIEHQHQAPSQQMLFEYAQTMAAIANEQSITDEAKIIDINTLEYLKGTESQSVYTFLPMLPMFDTEDANNFQGHLFVNNKTGDLDYLTISLTNSFSPELSIKLHRYDLKILFLNEKSVIHVKKIESRKVGKLLFVSQFDEKSTRLFSNFQHIPRF